MKRNGYELKAELLTHKFSRFLEEYAACRDDRLIVVNTHNMLVEACKVMETISNPTICVAFNTKFDEMEAQMEAIVTRFSGLVYKACCWTDPANSVFSVKVRQVVNGEDLELPMRRTLDEDEACAYSDQLKSEGHISYVVEELPDGSTRRV